MCLNINPDCHEHQPRHKAKVATRPLVVWKVLREYSTHWYDNKLCGNTWVSPIRQMAYHFGKLYTSVMDVNDYEVEAGLHALRARNQEEANDIWDLDTSQPYRQAFPALIPVGAEFYVGEDSDVVSNQLIVFRTMDELLKYCGVTKLSRPVSSSEF